MPASPTSPADEAGRSAASLEPMYLGCDLDSTDPQSTSMTIGIWIGGLCIWRDTLYDYTAFGEVTMIARLTRIHGGSLRFHLPLIVNEFSERECTRRLESSMSSRSITARLNSSTMSLIRSSWSMALGLTAR